MRSRALSLAPSSLRLIVLLVGFAALTFCLARVAISPGDGRTATQRDSVVRDAGKVRDAAGTLREEFRILNDTSETWRVKRVSSTCSCAGVEVPIMDISPGADLIAVVSVDLRGHRGRLTVSAFIEFESHPVLTVGVECDVQPVLRAEPSVVDVGRVAVGRSVTVPVRLVHEDGVEVVSWGVSDSQILAVSRSGTLGAVELLCAVTASERGSLPAGLHLEAQSSRGERLEIPVVGSAGDAFECTPSTIVLSPTRPSYCSITGLERESEIVGDVVVVAPVGVTVDHVPVESVSGRYARKFVITWHPGAVEGQVEFVFKSGAGVREVVRAKLLVDGA